MSTVNAKNHKEKVKDDAAQETFYKRDRGDQIKERGAWKGEKVGNKKGDQGEKSKSFKRGFQINTLYNTTISTISTYLPNISHQPWILTGMGGQTEKNWSQFCRSY